EDLGHYHFRRLQSDVLPAVHPRLYGHAEAVRGVSAGIPDAECALVRWRFDSRIGISDSVLLSSVVAEVRPDRSGESVGRHGARMADRFTTARRELRGHSGGHSGSLR